MRPFKSLFIYSVVVAATLGLSGCNFDLSSLIGNLMGHDDSTTEVVNNTPHTTDTHGHPTSGPRPNTDPDTVKQPSVEWVYRTEQENLAKAYAVATQGSDDETFMYYKAPELAIDGNPDTFNHTECNAQSNYLQLTFPFEVRINQIVVDPRDLSIFRIKDAKVYVGNADYKEDPESFEAVATLIEESEPQTFNFDPQLKARHIVVKAAGNNCLHLSEVEVYGAIPENPVIQLKQFRYMVRHDMPKGAVLFSLDAHDYQNDALTYRIDSGIPFAIDSNGRVTIAGSLTRDQYSFAVSVSDGTYEDRKWIVVDVTQPDAVKKALESGTVDHVTLDELLENVITEIGSDTQLFKTGERDKVKALYTHIQKKDYSFDWNKCRKKRYTHDKDLGSQYAICTDVPGYNDYTDALREIRRALNAIDVQGLNIFESTGADEHRLAKLMILIGDKIRPTIRYPMDKVKTDDTTFISALLADYSVFNNRRINRTQTDLGNFSRTDFSGVKHVNKTITMTSRKYFRAAGVYAFPGETFKVTRKDSSDVDVKVFVNSLREGSTHEYNPGGYKRPKKVQSAKYILKPNQTIELTSCYGGPIEVFFNKNDQKIELYFENVGLHPYWNGPEDDETFKAALDRGEFDWAEISTEGFEVHSTLEKMRTTVSEWGSAKKVANLTQKYTSNYPHVLAGFKGKGVEKVDEILDFASKHSLQVYNIDIVKHMNADQATCGFGCSGNPYDAYWAFGIIGHGDLHELGHGLEKGSLRFMYFEGHASTNPYAYYTQSRYNDDHKDTGEIHQCQALPFDVLYNKLQEAQKQNDPKAYMANYWKNDAKLGPQIVVTVEAMMEVQHKGKLKNGWHLLARMHILERERNRAKRDESTWNSMKDDLGFSTYSFEEFKQIPKNDYIVVTMSFAAELDLRPYFDMMGIEYTQKASKQIAAFGFEEADKNTYFASTPNGFCQQDKFGYMLGKQAIPVDGTSSYPQ